MKKHVVCFGELLLRLSPEGFSRLVQADRLQVCFTGGEANAGAALVRWGHEASLVSRVPAHEMGDACINFMRRFGLDTRYVQRGGDRLGLFYAETGVSQRQSMIIYDRKGSAFTGFSDEKLDWPELFAGAAWFHFAGTAPAVAPELGPVLARACAAARRLGIRVSCDLNYRSKLWSPAEAGRVMAGLLPQVDVFVCGTEDAANLFGITDADPGAGVAARLAERFGCSHVLVPRRVGHSATSNQFGALLWSGAGVAASRSHEIPFIVDRIGSGDALTAGVIHGLLEGWDLASTVEFAAAAACLKHTIPGDFNLVGAEEVLALARGDASGRIRR